MPLNIQPHSTWAQVYDLAYEHSFGPLYDQMTQTTIEVIESVALPPAPIVDFGAGTGRLSIPLAKLGYEITAVDPCIEMLEQIARKCQGQLRINHSKMEDFKTDKKYDVALCVFTVLLYILEEESLSKSFTAAHAALNPNGILLIDIPSKMIFHGYSTSDNLIERSVTLINQGGNIYRYSENLKIISSSGEESTFSDSFPIRYWHPEQVMEALQKAGFTLEADVSDRFSGTGSNYYLMRRSE